jgi:hypothetical protein
MLPFLAPLLKWPLVAFVIRNRGLIAVLIACAGLAFAGWKLRSWYEGAKDAADLRASIAERYEREKSANEHSARLEVTLAGITKEDLTLRRSLFDETRKDAYRCPVPVDGVRLFNAARTGRGSAGKPDR